MYLYKITEEEYNSLLIKQDGLCAICGGINKDSRPLFVDHDHNTGKIRGLLCYNCNSGLGHMADDVDRLRRAIEYLKQGSKR